MRVFGRAAVSTRIPAPAATAGKTAWAWAVATFFGAGLLKPGPGTWGSVAAMLLWMGTATVLRREHALPLLELEGLHIFFGLVTLAAVLITTALGIPAATLVARESGREDPGHVVIDEVAGQWLTLVVCRPDWAHALVALALFRLFDITKPWPIRQLERLPEGWGIMLDDLAAGLLGAIVLVLIQHWW
jgi:phosphatidylglycerophosphatase A